MAPAAGVQRFGRFELLFEIGSGGMARVYLARQFGDSGFERLVAVKRVHAHLVGDPDIYSMVSDEARIAALLRHPNVISVVDVVDRAGELLLVLDYVEGFALSKLHKRWNKPLPPAIASRVVVDALAGLHAAHEARDLLGERLDVVHRDVSPQNLLVGVDGVTRMIDFGIARARGNATLTQTGVVKGKVAYMAPERLDEKAVDRRADLFAMGAVLNELVLGDAARSDGDEARDLARAMLGSFDPSAVARVAPKLAAILERSLARSPRDRFATADEMARAISAAEPPAPTHEIAAWVVSLEEAAITERRAKITAAVEASIAAEAGDDASAPREGGVAPIAHAKDASPAIDAIDPAYSGAPSAPEISRLRASLPGRDRRSPALWVGLGLAGLAAANAAVWFALRPKDAASASEARVAAASATSPPREPMSSAVELPGDRAREPSAPAAPAPSAAASASTSVASPTPPSRMSSSRGTIGAHPSGTPSASGTTGLQANPYASH